MNLVGETWFLQEVEEKDLVREEEEETLCLAHLISLVKVAEETTWCLDAKRQ